MDDLAPKLEQCGLDLLACADENEALRRALAASAARIEALTEALREIEAHLADHWNCGAVQLFLIASRALVTARAALDAAPRSDGPNYLPPGAADLADARTIDDGRK